MSSPEQVRAAVAGYVQEIHRAYVDQALTFTPGVRGRMPLLASGSFTVVAAAARKLHLLATTERLGPVQGPEVAVEASYRNVAWELRFFDSVVAPDLGLLDERENPDFDGVRRALGIGTVLYHLVAGDGAALSAHNATHVGTGLANGHSAVARDFETIRSRVRGRETLVDELSGAAVAGLPHAQALLAQAIAPHDADLAAVCHADPLDPDAIRKALLTGVGGRTQWQSQDPVRAS
jgi:hypothetical protein